MINIPFASPRAHRRTGLVAFRDANWSFRLEGDNLSLEFTDGDGNNQHFRFESGSILQTTNVIHYANYVVSQGRRMITACLSQVCGPSQIIQEFLRRLGMLTSPCEFVILLDGNTRIQVQRVVATAIGACLTAADMTIVTRLDLVATGVSVLQDDVAGSSRFR